MNDKLCDGCISKKMCFFMYKNKYGLNSSNCPCQECLIKKVCFNPCEEYEAYYDSQKTIFDKVNKFHGI